MPNKLILTFILLATPFMASADEAALESVIKNVISKYQGSSEIRNISFDGPLIKEDPVIYVLDLNNRHFSIGVTARPSNYYEVRLISKTKGIGPATVRKLKEFTDSIWKYLRKKKSKVGSWSGSHTLDRYNHSVSFSLRGDQEKFMTGLLNHLAKDLQKN